MQVREETSPFSPPVLGPRAALERGRGRIDSSGVRPALSPDFSIVDQILDVRWSEGSRRRIDSDRMELRTFPAPPHGEERCTDLGPARDRHTLCARRLKPTCVRRVSNHEAGRNAKWRGGRGASSNQLEVQQSHEAETRIYAIAHLTRWRKRRIKASPLLTWSLVSPPARGRPGEKQAAADDEQGPAVGRGFHHQLGVPGTMHCPST